MSDTHRSIIAGGGQRLVVPDSLKRQLHSFRDRVWTIKLVEALVLGSVGLLLAFLTVYLCDRFFDTPRPARAGLFIAALLLWLAVPRALHRWVWNNRRLDQLARLLRVREPQVGDQLLSAIELADNHSEQSRSPALCAAAIQQVAEVAKSRDFLKATPPTRLRSLSLLLAASAVATVLLATLFPTAAGNAWARFSSPWRDTPRYTFTALEPVASQRVVPHGEATEFQVQLASDSRWHPESAKLQIGNLPALSAANVDDRYSFEIPPLTAPVLLKLNIGDYAQVVRLEPKLRPELIAAAAQVHLPDYLQRGEPYQQDVRSGSLSAVQGSRVTIESTASRAIAAATINDQAVAVQQASFSSDEVELDGDPQQMQMWWEDFDHLAGRETFDLSLKPTEDELPSVVAQDLPRQAVVLDSEQINFQALAADDFGIRAVGIEWRGLDERLVNGPTAGEKLLSAGGPTNTSLQIPATFSAVALGIMPQPIEVRLWVEDYYPDRPRSYTPPHVLFVLTAEEHAIWITSQLSKWHRSALDVRDTEMQLHAANKRLRDMSTQELADDDMRAELHRQASLEGSNARRLSALSQTGEGLLRQAARNPEIGVGHLERWAEMLQTLNDIGENRMPSVSDLLEKASTQETLARAAAQKPSAPKPSAPHAGEVRTAPSGAAKDAAADEDQEKPPEAPQMPSIADMESSQQTPDDEASDPADEPSKKKKYNGSKLSLPNTTLAGPAPKSSDEQPPEEDEPEDEKEPFQMALEEQAAILEEFEKITEELNTVLANLEGSTLVKRLKAASREQNQVAEKISSQIDQVFGKRSTPKPEVKSMLSELTGVQHQSSQNISYIMDDMQAYFERRRMNQFKVVLDDMKAVNVLDAIRELGDEIPKEQGMSIAQAEYWSDTLDRWGEDLVDPASSGQCPGSKTSDALPPSLILEVLKVLESEVNLREATRVAQQARAAVEPETHSREATRLSETQAELRARTNAVVTAIEELPSGGERFENEVQLLSSVSSVMDEATRILATSETGATAIAAETEAIELLLQCKRINPKGGGGGGGATPGGGGTGTTQDSALALLGSGLNQHEKREARDVAQATGETGRVLPEEFRAGLDEYFNRLEQ